jgi:hypothetical protein
MQTYKDCIRKTAEDFGISYEECEYIIMKSSFDLNSDDDSSDEDFYIQSSSSSDEDYDDDEEDSSSLSDKDDYDKEELDVLNAYDDFFEKVIDLQIEKNDSHEVEHLAGFFNSQDPIAPQRGTFYGDSKQYNRELIKYYVHMYKIYTAEQLVYAAMMLNSYILLVAAFSKFKFKTKNKIKKYLEYLTKLEKEIKMIGINDEIEDYEYLSVRLLKYHLDDIFNAPRNGLPISWLEDYASKISKDELNKNKVKALLANDPTEFIKTMHGQDFANMIYSKL